ncbi:unnamed protein product [Eretmochelys imbricata]
MEAIASQMGTGRDASSSPNSKQELQPYSGSNPLKPNQVGETSLYGVPIVSLVIDGQERLCLAQISNTLLKNYSYNEIHNRRVALGITCVQCTPVQLEILRRAGAMPISSRRCGMITKREAERLCKSFLGEHKPPKLPENFAFDVVHECAWGSRGSFIPARYNSSRAKCIKCGYCSMYFSPNKFIFHSHRTPDSKYTQPDAANFNSWRRHLKLGDKTATDELSHAWEDVKAMFNGGTRKRTFSLHGAAAAGASPAAKAALHPPPPGGADLAPAHKSLRCSGEEAPGERGALSLAGAHGGAGAVRSYPVIPVPSKGFGMLQKLPPPLFPHPYGFPAAAFGLCPKKQEDSLGGAGGGEPGKGGALPPGMFWGHPHPHQPQQQQPPPPHQAGAGKDGGVYPPFPMFWPAAGSLPVPPYPAQSQAKAAATAVVVAAAAAAAARRRPPGPGRPPQRAGGLGAVGQRAQQRHPAGGLRGGRRALLQRPLQGGRRGGAVRGRGAAAPAAPAPQGQLPLRLPPRGEGRGEHRQAVRHPGGLRRGGPGRGRLPVPGLPQRGQLQLPLPLARRRHGRRARGGRGVQPLPRGRGGGGGGGGGGAAAAAQGGGAAAAASGRGESRGAGVGGREPAAARGEPAEERQQGRLRAVYTQEREDHLQALKNAASLGPAATYLCNPEANEQDKDDNHSTAEDLETSKSYQDQRNVSHPSPVNTDRGEEGLSIDFMGTQLVEKDIENLARDELQKLLLEQVELRKKLEREFQSLKDNFQDQMKRELAYREEMVQQLQIVRDTLCNELDQERKARYAIQQKLKEAHDALHHFSCKMLTPRHCTGNCSFKPPLLPQ